MNRQIVEKICDFIENLRALGFNGAKWTDIQAAMGELSTADKKALGQYIIDAGAVQRPDGIFDFSDLAIDLLYTADIPEESNQEKIKLVSVFAKVSAGTWGRDAAGKIRFVKDPSYHFGIGNDEEDNTQDEDDDPDDGSFNSPRKGKLDIDL